MSRTAFSIVDAFSYGSSAIQTEKRFAVKWKRTDKPDSVTALACYDGHSSVTHVTVRLKLPTRRLRGTHVNACLFGIAPGRDCPFHPD